MINLTIKNNSQSQKIEFQNNVKGKELSSYFSENKSPLIALKVNNKIISLSSTINVNATVEGVFLNSQQVSSLYKNSLIIVLAKACFSLFPENPLVIGSTYYYTLKDKILSEGDIKNIQNEMNKIIGNDEEFTENIYSYEDAISILKNEGLTETIKQLKYNVSPTVKLNDLNGYKDFFMGPCVPSAKYLKIFEIKKYQQGFLLRLPVDFQTDNLSLPTFVDAPKFFKIFTDYKEWGEKVGVSSVSDLNEFVVQRKINDFIDIAETFQSQAFARVSEEIFKRKKVKVVLIAGPSSSGKTTSSKKIALHLTALGFKPKIISLDSYYVGRDKNPKDENGNYDYECLEALDIELLNQNLNDLFSGKEVLIPSYNFDLGERFYTGEKMKLSKNDILIMEGIHGLNDALTPKIPKEYKFKVYLSPLTELTLNGHYKISTSDNRLIRRIVRDSRYRGKSAEETISMWNSVRKGEYMHIFPFQNNADAVLNTSLDYELCVLKVYVSPLLKAVKPSSQYFNEAQRLLTILNNYQEFSDNYIPKQAIVREFIGGSSFHY